MDTTVQALIIAAMEYGWAYHMLKKWGYTTQQRRFIKWFGSDMRRMTGNVYELRMILDNPTMKGI